MSASDDNLMRTLAGLLAGTIAPASVRGLLPPGGLADAARHHGVAGLLCRRLRAGGRLEELDPADVAALERRFAGQVARGALQWSEIRRVIPALRSAGIPLRVLKGAVLALTVYEDPADRPMDDLDLLVPPERTDAAVAVLSGLGYERREIPSLRPGYARRMLKEENYAGPPPANLLVELHWGLVAGPGSRYRPDMEWFWAPAGGAGARAEGDAASLPAEVLLPPTQHLLYLAVHQRLQHFALQRRLIWLLDIDRLVRAGADPAATIDWDELIDRAIRFRWAAAAAAALRDAVGVLATPVPAGVLRRLDEGASDVDRSILAAASGIRTARDRVAVAMRSHDGPTRVRILGSLAFPSREYLRWRYPGRERTPAAALYLRRWFDLVASVVGRARRYGD